MDTNMSNEDEADANSEDLHETTRNCKLTLGDFITSMPPSRSSHRVRQRLSKRSEVNTLFEIISTKPASMVDISKLRIPRTFSK
ncbi:hypothetical protein ANCCAN_24341 [Ancylostoma caninum]|uniref:Uncharacterized protein n=1 Tax=Ancylostoma caninum TaxID=29170 RepID=A0A368FCP3_ANCCA|nr:hypothetical protein ANCCAN_24341 [Ancylostoma caninum]